MRDHPLAIPVREALQATVALALLQTSGPSTSPGLQLGRCSVNQPGWSSALSYTCSCSSRSSHSS
jgi:hypothetical protein